MNISYYPEYYPIPLNSIVQVDDFAQPFNVKVDLFGITLADLKNKFAGKDLQIVDEEIDCQYVLSQF